MSRIITIIEALPKLLPLKPAAITDISDAESQLNLRFAGEYKQYLAKFGAILADGVELTGIAKSKDRNVIAITKQERELNPYAQSNLYVVQNIGIEGIIIWQDEKGRIYKSTPNNAPVEIALSLSDYIESKK